MRKLGREKQAKVHHIEVVSMIYDGYHCVQRFTSSFSFSWASWIVFQRILLLLFVQNLSIPHFLLENRLWSMDPLDINFDPSNKFEFFSVHSSSSLHPHFLLITFFTLIAMSANRFYPYSFMPFCVIGVYSDQEQLHAIKKAECSELSMRFDEIALRNSLIPRSKRIIMEWKRRMVKRVKKIADEWWQVMEKKEEVRRIGWQ